MNDTAPQSALREWRDHMVQPLRAACLFGAAAILGLVGPFETGESIRFVPRLGYWLAIVILCYSAGYFSSAITKRIVGPHSGMLKTLAVDGVMTAIGVLAMVYVINGVLIGYWATGRELAILAANVVAISAIISAVFFVAERQSMTDEVNKPAPSSLLDRLPFHKRGPLVSLSVEDHYVRVRTTKGEDMILMRLADAIREVGMTAGLQVHRSHWIALDQVTAAARKGDGAVLSMTQGPDIPVSRANISSIKEAGLLPRT